ncbi:TetR/AcrR family transcriptional regulator [Micromonospora sp. NBC_01699]|uniref:TetR/AcrR family transcriptional regulator n=1 Tax=Micromonospora sp. NBC_01699 TaxID=2975984 RepID=UPI002E2B2D6D|nr:TetR family transcriptional regulator [Micromonospora sp. NBC_01699]
MSEIGSTLRDRRRAETQRTIQIQAVRLFIEHGYQSVTVNQVAEAAGVSPMTLYRHFATKEDLVLVDQIDRLIAERIAAGPPDGSPVQRIGRALIETAAAITGSPDGANELLLDRLKLMISTPALRARHLDSQYAMQQAIVDALCGENADAETEFRVRASSGACLAALHVALTRWAGEDGRPDLPDLIATALSAALDGQADR